MLTIVCRRHSLNKTIRIRYCLICRSNKPEAEQFETWVFDELLPRIRQTGGYVNDPVVFGR